MQLERGLSWLGQTGVVRKGKSPYAFDCLYFKMQGVFLIFNFALRLSTNDIRAHLHCILYTSATWSTCIRSRSSFPSCVSCLLSKELMLLLSVVKSPAIQSLRLFRASLSGFIIHTRSCSITPEFEKHTTPIWDDSSRHHALPLLFQRCFDLGFLA